MHEYIIGFDDKDISIIISAQAQDRSAIFR